MSSPGCSKQKTGGVTVRTGPAKESVIGWVEGRCEYRKGVRPLRATYLLEVG